MDSAVRANDVIVALATAPGRSGVGILRLSGPDLHEVARRLIRSLPPPRQAQVRTFLDARGRELDRGLVLRFCAPASFTGEDVLELHAHGGPVLLDALIESAVAAGARLARPGEFTERAFLNGRIDLAQAEAVADVIDAGSTEALRGAVRSLRGEFSARVSALSKAILGVRVQTEARIDFSDEEIEAVDRESLLAALHGVLGDLDALCATARTGSLLREGVQLAVVGRPNVGKSTLLNALVGHAAAIVTPVPGTTRDVVRERLCIDGLVFHLSDTAGLRATDDAVERIGITRTWEAVESAGLVLLVVDDRCALADEDEQVLSHARASDTRVIVVRNKIDLSGATPGVCSDGPTETLRLCATGGQGLAELRSTMKRVAGYCDSAASGFTARQRHLVALAEARAALHRAIELTAAEAGLELVAEELRIAQCALGEITGEVSSERLLSEIFATFCIGK